MRATVAVNDAIDALEKRVASGDLMDCIMREVAESPLCTQADLEEVHGVLLHPAVVGGAPALTDVGTWAVRAGCNILLRELRSCDPSNGATGIMYYKYQCAITRELGGAQHFSGQPASLRRHCLMVVSRAVHTAMAQAHCDAAQADVHDDTSVGVDAAEQLSFVQRTAGWNIASLLYLYTKNMRSLKQEPQPKGDAAKKKWAEREAELSGRLMLLSAMCRSRENMMGISEFNREVDRGALTWPKDAIVDVLLQQDSSILAILTKAELARRGVGLHRYVLTLVETDQMTRARFFRAASAVLATLSKEDRALAKAQQGFICLEVSRKRVRSRLRWFCDKIGADHARAGLTSQGDRFTHMTAVRAATAT